MNEAPRGRIGPSDESKVLARLVLCVSQCLLRAYYARSGADRLL